MRIYRENNRAKFYADPIWNEQTEPYNRFRSLQHEEEAEEQEEQQQDE